jgi:phosphomannomutase
MTALIISISGIRGIIGENLGPVEAAEFGQAYGTFLRRRYAGPDRPKVCVGRDSRPSGAMLSQAIQAGLMAAGCDTIDLAIVTTPGTALMVNYLKTQGGIVITASHNPIQWNGVKFLRDDGFAYPADEVRQIHQNYHNRQYDLQNSLAVGSGGADSRTHAVHVDTVLQLCDKKLIASKRFKVVLDSVNGAGCVVTSNLLSALGCEVVHLNGRPTGIFPHEPEPTADNLKDLGPEIRKHNAAVGFAQDPDADRLAIVDEKGTYLGEEYTLALAAKYIFSRKQGKAAANLSTSRMIDDLAAAAGSEVIRTPVGEAHVAEAMKKNQCIIGGEGNGGVIDLRVGPVRDSLVGIVLTLQLMAQTGKTVSELVAEIPRYSMKKTKFPCDSGRMPSLLNKVAEFYRQTDSGDLVGINTQDGVRVDLRDGWVHIRASNTEPIMRVIAESGDPSRCEALIRQVRELIQA